MKYHVNEKSNWEKKSYVVWAFYRAFSQTNL